MNFYSRVVGVDELWVRSLPSTLAIASAVLSSTNCLGPQGRIKSLRATVALFIFLMAS